MPHLVLAHRGEAIICVRASQQPNTTTSTSSGSEPSRDHAIAVAEAGVDLEGQLL